MRSTYAIWERTTRVFTFASARPSLLGRIAAWVFLLVVLLVVFFLLLPLLIVLAVLAALAEGLRSLFRRGWPGRAATDDDGRKNVRIARHDPDQDVRG